MALGLDVRARRTTPNNVERHTRFARNRVNRRSLLSTAIILSLFSGFIELFAIADSGRALTIGEEDRRTIARYQKLYHYSDKEMDVLLGGTVRVICPWGFGTGAIVDRKDTLVTAAHLFFKANGKPRGPIARCYAVSLKGGKKHRIKLDTVAHGFKEHPNLDWNDWFVATLQDPMKSAPPYPIRDEPMGSNVFYLTQGQEGWPGHSVNAPSIGRCELIQPAGISLLSIFELRFWAWWVWRSIAGESLRPDDGASQDFGNRNAVVFWQKK